MNCEKVFSEIVLAPILCTTNSEFVVIYKIRKENPTAYFTLSESSVQSG